MTDVEIINSELYHPSNFYSKILTKNGTQNGKPTFVARNGNKNIVIRWSVIHGGWTISGETSQTEIVRFISRSDVSSPVDVISWIYLPNGTINEMVAAPLMYVNGK